jgi:hypothetical protein
MDKLKVILKDVIEKTVYGIPLPLLLEDYIAEVKERLRQECDLEYADIIDDKALDQHQFTYSLDLNKLVKVYGVKIPLVVKCWGYIFTVEILVETLKIPVESTQITAKVVIKTVLVIVR